MNLTKICGSKLKKAQHIVELALLAPFIMFFIGIVYQIAITIQTNYKFNASLNEAISFMALKNKIVKEEDASLAPLELKEKTAKDIKQYAEILLGERYAPNKDSLEIKLISSGDIDLLIGLYRYTSTFKIFNGLENFNPQDYNYMAIIPVNSAILRQNSFEIPNDFFETVYIIKPYTDNPSEDNDTEENDGTEDNENEETNENSSNENTPENTDSTTSQDNTSETGTDDISNIDIPEVQF